MKLRTILAPLLGLPLAACISFGGKPPSALMVLDSTATTPVGETWSTKDHASITISPPTTSQELATPRVPVRERGIAIAYVKDAAWVEPPASLFARLLGDTIGAKTGRVVLTGRQSQVDPGARLSGELRQFGVDADASEAVVTYDAALKRGDEPVFEKRRFEARVSLTRIEAAEVGAALNEAANKVAAEVAEWVGS